MLKKIMKFSFVELKALRSFLNIFFHDMNICSNIMNSEIDLRFFQGNVWFHQKFWSSQRPRASVGFLLVQSKSGKT